MTHNEALAVRDRIAQALPGHRVEVVPVELCDPVDPCRPSTMGGGILVDNFYLLSSADPLGGVQRIFGVEA